MKNTIALLILLGVLGLSAGCHSGTTRGIGSDISKIGDNLQK